MPQPLVELCQWENTAPKSCGRKGLCVGQRRDFPHSSPLSRYSWRNRVNFNVSCYSDPIPYVLINPVSFWLKVSVNTFFSVFLACRINSLVHKAPLTCKCPSYTLCWASLVWRDAFPSGRSLGQELVQLCSLGDSSISRGWIPQHFLGVFPLVKNGFSLRMRCTHLLDFSSE